MLMATDVIVKPKKHKRVKLLSSKLTFGRYDGGKYHHFMLYAFSNPSR